ncbi:hypothetical protein [Paracoccus jiaweipingae]|uniref:hypothetical protein n=1 Tax=Paracoccus sp. p2-l61 TaxID=3366950 RepID=UPI0037BCDD00
MSTESLPRSSCIAEHRADLGASKGAATPGPEARGGFWTRIKRANARFEASIWGDLTGAVFLAVMVWALFVIAGCLS